MPSPERTPREKETLMYDNPESATQFRERIERDVQRQQQPGINSSREVVAQVVADEFLKEGEVPHTLSQPWEHTEAEHVEVQSLVDTAFAKDLRAALAKARTSTAYPRNIDLFHDVLTGEMYEALQAHTLTKQPTIIWGVVIIGIVIIVLMTLGFVFFRFFL